MIAREWWAESPSGEVCLAPERGARGSNRLDGRPILKRQVRLSQRYERQGLLVGLVALDSVRGEAGSR
jgi:hypothetical protein